MASIRITALVENTAAGDLLGEHGLAFWIETSAGVALVDTGQGEALPHNAARLGADLSRIKALIVSHGHYDHTGGLAAEMAAAPRAAVCFHPAAMEPKFTRRPEGSQVRFIGMSDAGHRAIEEHSGRILHANGPLEVMPGLFVTGPIPRTSDFEDTGGEFFLDEACTKTDPLVDDQAVYFSTPSGVVILLGCAHSGVVNTLKHVRKLTGDTPIHAVIGGMHLVHAGEGRLSRTVTALSEMKVAYVYPAHCTGPAATARLCRDLQDHCVPCVTGMRLEFDMPSRPSAE